MKRFRSYVQLVNESVEAPYLLEYLTPAQEKKFSKYKMSDEARSSTDHFFGQGNDRVEEDVIDSHHDKSEPHKKVEQHIGKELSHDEYKSGLTSDKYGRQVKLSKLIRDPGVQQEFARDNTRSGVKAIRKPKMSIVRGTHVAGQTNSAPDKLHPTGHSWGDESCKNVDNGGNKHYLRHEIEHGSVAVFAHDHDGKEIYRATLHPHHNEAGDVAYALNSEYGIKNAAFTAHAHDVAKRLSGGYKPGLFKIHKKVYDDSGAGPMLHPNATADDITTALKDKSVAVREAALRHPAATAEHITAALKDKHEDVRAQAIKHPNATAEHITAALKDKDAGVRSTAIRHPNATLEHLSAAMKDVDASVRSNAIKHSKITPEHITAALKDADAGVRMDAIKHPNATTEHISTALKDENKNVRFVAIKHPNATVDHITAALKDPEQDVRSWAIDHPKATAEHIQTALKDDNANMRYRAMDSKNPNITADHITAALKDEDPRVRFAAVRHPNATAEHITTGMKDQDHRVRLFALQNKHVTAEHIAAGLKDTDERVRSSAKEAKEKLALMNNAKPADEPKHTISLAGGKLKFNESVVEQKKKISRFKNYTNSPCGNINE